ncbi:hypothetical protein PLESTB_001152400 [Pleodorina starrii]|uniref:Uncharacterized protein n=1 Tax=Pleodorina starrii TaxID=330485 RepID=A0A9W6F5B5_9CHLO|nr:hypothetical protein PLESTB_001152400 [Pleodorina starrii]GLC68154.1 hypothetical protein PLESTF_000654200 [Pleodorina starrii]
MLLVGVRVSVCVGKKAHDIVPNKDDADSFQQPELRTFGSVENCECTGRDSGQPRMTLRERLGVLLLGWSRSCLLVWWLESWWFAYGKAAAVRHLQQLRPL